LRCRRRGLPARGAGIPEEKEKQYREREKNEEKKGKNPMKEKKAKRKKNDKGTVVRQIGGWSCEDWGGGARGKGDLTLGKSL